MFIYLNTLFVKLDINMVSLLNKYLRKARFIHQNKKNKIFEYLNDGF